VSPYWVLPVYVELIRAVWADDAMGTGHYYFDKMRSSLKLVQNQLNLSNRTSSSMAVQKKGTCIMDQQF
jgi:hypothetical protein